MVPSKRPGPAGRTTDPGLSGCGTRDRARWFTAVLLAEVQMLQDLEAVGDKQREEISGRAHRFDCSSRRVNLNQRIKSLSGRGSGGFAVVHVTGQAVYAYPLEPGRTAANCNPDCNPGGSADPLLGPRRLAGPVTLCDSPTHSSWPPAGRSGWRPTVST